MTRSPQPPHTVAALSFDEHPPGVVLQPLVPGSDITRDLFLGWVTPMAPWGGFNLDSGMEIVEEGNRHVLAFTRERDERALVYDVAELRDATLTASLLPEQTDASPHNDRHDCHEALVGIAFRIQNSRAYYFFGIEGQKRCVLYRRRDDEWYRLAQQEIEPPDGYLDLEVQLDGNAIRCHCPSCRVDFFCTDTTYSGGKVGFRSLGRSRLASFTICQTDAQQRRESLRRVAAAEASRSLGEEIPDPVLLQVIDHKKLGGTPQFVELTVPGRFDMLITGPQFLRAMTSTGEVLWETDFAVQQMVFSKGFDPPGRRIYVMRGKRQVQSQRDIQGRTSTTTIPDEMVVLDAATGELLATRPLPELHERIRIPDYAQTSAAFTDQEGTDIVLREWREDLGGGGRRLWAYDGALRPLWEAELPGAWYGHHYAVQVYDVDGDGTDELLAGGTLLDASGRTIWTHDRDEEVLAIAGSQHYDAVALGHFTEDEGLDPVAFLLAGSGGVYVVDGLTGETRAIHRIGHAQGRMIGKLRRDIPGEQILAATRWGNMGILTLFSGQGERLWTIQPDYIGQGSRPIQWGDLPTQLIWTCTTGPVQAFYDGYGRRVKVLHELRRLWGDRPRTQVSSAAIRLGTGTSDLLAVTLDARTYVFGPRE